MAQVNKVAEYMKSIDRSQSGYFERVDNIAVYLSVFGLGFELTTDEGSMYINKPDEEQQRMLYGLLAKLENSGKPVDVMGGVKNGSIDYLSY